MYVVHPKEDFSLCMLFIPGRTSLCVCCLFLGGLLSMYDDHL